MTSITALPRFCLFELQGQESDLIEWCGPDLFFASPAPCRLAVSDNRELLRVSHSTWLLRAPPDHEQSLLDRLRVDHAPDCVSVVEVSDVYSFYDLGGNGLVHVMSVLSSLDYPELPTHSATFTEALGLKVLLIKYDSRCHLGLECSYAAAFERLLTDEMKEVVELIDFNPEPMP